MPTLNVKSILDKFTAPNNILKGGAKSRALMEFKRYKRQLQGDFNSHPVTLEIEAGNQAGNTSRTLNKGNLFAFIGFVNGDNPTGQLWEILDAEIDIDRDEPKSVKRVQNTLFYGFRIIVPNLRKIYSDPRTKYPSEKMSGSWVQGIEKGIPFAEFFYFVRSGFGPFSRSGTGLQRKTPSNSRYKATPYISLILDKFIAKIEKK